LPLPGQGTPEEQEMIFHLIKDIDEKQINGVLIESNEGLICGRLAGDKGTDDPANVIPSLLRRTPPKGFPMEAKVGETRVVSWVRPGQPGYLTAALRRLGPPLKLSRSGNLTKSQIDVPDRMTLKLWETFAEGDAPPHEELPLR
jgi:hypothetical protein